jgi:hypothetical protein
VTQRDAQWQKDGKAKAAQAVRKRAGGGLAEENNDGDFFLQLSAPANDHQPQVTSQHFLYRMFAAAKPRRHLGHHKPQGIHDQASSVSAESVNPLSRREKGKQTYTKQVQKQKTRAKHGIGSGRRGADT